MKIDSQQLRNRPAMSLDFNEIIELPESYSLAEREVKIHFKGFIESRLNFYTLSGRLKARLVFSCDNCLKLVELPLDLTMKESFIEEGEKAALQSSDNMEAIKADLPEDFFYFEKGVIDLTPVIVTLICLSIPLKVLCQEDCKGLCSFCGADLNLGDCGCEKPTDPRFEGLRAFFQDKEEV